MLTIVLITFIFGLSLLHWLVYKLVVWKKGREQARTILFSMLTLSVTLVTCVGIAEIASRVLLNDITTTADGTSFFSDRWHKREGVQLNSFGFREQELVLNTKPNVFRIAVIGDSFTYGQGIPESERFSNIMERELTSNKNLVEVLNFGIRGAGTIDHIETLNKYVIPADPGFILLQWFINDVEGLNKSHQPTQKKISISQKIVRRLHKRSALYYLVNNLLQNIKRSAGSTEQNYEKYLIDNYSDPESNAAKLANDAIYEFIKNCKRESIPVGIVLFPQPTESLANDYSLAFLSDRILSQCEHEQIPCLDLRETYSKIKPVSLLWVNRFDQHPGTLANQLAAEQIISYFGKEWLQSKKVYK